MASKGGTFQDLYKSLTLIAAALPGLQEGHAAGNTKAEKAKVETGYTHWSENKNRYDIDIYQAAVEVSLNDKMDLTIGAERDVMSGASNILYVPERTLYGAGSPSKLIELKSCCSKISDIRNQATANFRYFLPDTNYGLLLGHSNENDYRSLFVSPSMQINLNKNNTSLNLSYGFSKDQTYPTDAINLLAPPRRPEDTGRLPHQIEKKYTNTFSFGIHQDFTKTSYGLLNAEYIYDSGFLADPYKKVLIWGDPGQGSRPGSFYAQPFFPQFGNITFDYDRRPDTRHTMALAGRYVQYFESYDSSAHLDYRFARNSWGIYSHTIQASYHQPFAETWEIVPKIRYYTQSASDFYAMAFHVAPGSPFPSKPLPSALKNSTDYRLSSFGNIGAEVKINKTFWDENKIGLLLGYRFNRDSLGIQRRGNPHNPSNDYNVFYAGLNLSIKDAGFGERGPTPDKDYYVQESFYPQGSFSLKPLTINMSTLSGKFSKNDSKLNGVAYDVFGTRGFGLSHTTRNGLSYGLELGYFAFKNFELFIRPSFTFEKGADNIYLAPTLNPAIDRALNFKNRTTYGFSFGGRKYFDLNKRWLPFVGAAIGFESQGATKAKVYSLSLVWPTVKTPIGDFQLQGRKTYLIGDLEAGVDYKMTDWLAFTLTAGLNIKQLPAAQTTTIINGVPFSYKDNHRQVTFPLSLSVKFTF